MMSGVLEGIRVLDFGRYIAGPFCGTLLGDLGAEVIRIEKLDGSEDRWVTPVTEGGEGAMFLQIGPNLLRPIWRNIAPWPPSVTGVTQRSSLPSSFSMRITSAPRSPSRVPQKGPAMYRPKSRTRIPSRTPGIMLSLERRSVEESVGLQEDGQYEAAFVGPCFMAAAGTAPDILAALADAGMVGQRPGDHVGLLDLDMFVPRQARARCP